LESQEVNLAETAEQIELMFERLPQCHGSGAEALVIFNNEVC